MVVMFMNCITLIVYLVLTFIEMDKKMLAIGYMARKFPFLWGRNGVDFSTPIHIWVIKHFYHLKRIILNFKFILLSNYVIK